MTPTTWFRELLLCISFDVDVYILRYSSVVLQCINPTLRFCCIAFFFRCIVVTLVLEWSSICIDFFIYIIYLVLSYILLVICLNLEILVWGLPSIKYHPMIVSVTNSARKSWHMSRELINLSMFLNFSLSQQWSLPNLLTKTYTIV